MSDHVHLSSTTIRELAVLSKVSGLTVRERHFVQDITGRTVLSRKQARWLRQIRERHRTTLARLTA